MDPIKTADAVFTETRTSLMAHTIRGVVNHFRRSAVELDVRVIADSIMRIGLSDPNRGATSVLHSRFIPSRRDGERDRVVASIFIHKDANKHLARLCIAHEMYHLLLELNGYLANNRTEWASVKVTPSLEDDCNVFAWQLCRSHDNFNKDEGSRRENIYFPDRLFDAPLKTSTTNHHSQWPEGIALDPSNPFYKRPPVSPGR